MAIAPERIVGNELIDIYGKVDRGERLSFDDGLRLCKTPNLTAEGRSALEEIAATMRANPKIEQVSISLGTKGVKADLSDKRAQQIIIMLRTGNLDSERYEVVLQDDLKAGAVLIRLTRP